MNAMKSVEYCDHVNLRFTDNDKQICKNCISYDSETHLENSDAVYCLHMNGFIGASHVCDKWEKR